MTQRTKFNKFKRLFSECRRVFPYHQRKIKRLLEVVREINAYIRELCDNSEIHMPELDEIIRDTMIFQSRSKNLYDKLYNCSLSVASLTSTFKRNPKQNEAMVGRVEDTIVEFADWHAERQDFHVCFKKAEAKWLKIENDILAKITGAKA